ncbi:histidine kinase dimerization/phospho-acceptor domain-containing protein, partial [Saccharopolyspora shandongensis]|uniref:histidine kinase dimerization/phospho-acceptor domain-containing protein n=1 Tax=Saccharopolyspora shandongensis TaxID=418495 RepID=UPI0033E9C1FF
MPQHHPRSVGHPSDEFTELADTIDTMLDRLHTSFQAQQRFAANASHELRTPLATTRTMLQVALAHPGDHDLTTLWGSTSRPTGCDLWGSRSWSACPTCDYRCAR